MEKMTRGEFRCITVPLSQKEAEFYHCVTLGHNDLYIGCSGDSNGFSLFELMSGITVDETGFFREHNSSQRYGCNKG